MHVVAKYNIVKGVFKEGEFNMSSDERIIELLTDILHEQPNTRKDVQFLQDHQSKTTSAIEVLQEQQMKTNAAIGKLPLSVMWLADDILRITEHEGRIVRLEAEVFKS